MGKEQQHLCTMKEARPKWRRLGILMDWNFTWFLRRPWKKEDGYRWWRRKRDEGNICMTRRRIRSFRTSFCSQHQILLVYLLSLVYSILFCSRISKFISKHQQKTIKSFFFTISKNSFRWITTVIYDFGIWSSFHS